MRVAVARAFWQSGLGRQAGGGVGLMEVASAQRIPLQTPRGDICGGASEGRGEGRV